VNRALLYALAVVTAGTAGGVVWSAGRGRAGGDEAALPPTQPADPPRSLRQEPPAAFRPAKTSTAETLPADASPAEPSPATNPSAAERPGWRDLHPSRPMPPAYANLLQRSLFAPRGQKAAKGRGDDAPAERPEARFVLRGVSQQAGRFDAFVEDVGGGSRVLRLRPGDSIARGHIRRVSFDAIEYEAAGQSVRVGIGHDLTGAANSVATATVANSAGKSGRDRSNRSSKSAGGAGPATGSADAGGTTGGAGGDEGKGARAAVVIEKTGKYKEPKAD
jgi:hypothetical protein